MAVKNLHSPDISLTAASSGYKPLHGRGVVSTLMMARDNSIGGWLKGTHHDTTLISLLEPNGPEGIVRASK